MLFIPTWNPGGYVCVQSLSRVQLFATPWTVARQAPLWNSPCKNAGVGCHALLQESFLTQGSNRGLLRLLHCRWILYHWTCREAWRHFWKTSVRTSLVVLWLRLCASTVGVQCFLIYLFFNWKVIALQNFVGFCFTSNSVVISSSEACSVSLNCVFFTFLVCLTTFS